MHTYVAMCLTHGCHSSFLVYKMCMSKSIVFQYKIMSWVSKLKYFILFFFGETGVWCQCFMIANKALDHLGYTSSSNIYFKIALKHDVLSDKCDENTCKVHTFVSLKNWWVLRWSKCRNTPDSWLWRITNTRSILKMFYTFARSPINIPLKIIVEINMWILKLVRKKRTQSSQANLEKEDQWWMYISPNSRTYMKQL
jgi:hypothetical protein